MMHDTNINSPLDSDKKVHRHTILLVDDEPDILELIGYNLSQEGFDVHTASNGKEGVEAAIRIRPDLIIMDVMMPEMDGILACAQIRKEPTLSNCIIALLTARGEDYSQMAGFDSGADDYIMKPVKPQVLISRIKALLRRVKVNQAKIEKAHNGITLDKDSYLVIQAGRKISLPKKEFELLSLLWSQPGVVFDRETILSSVWGNDVVVGDRTIDVHIRKLRSKLGNEHFVTIKGVGYKFGA